MFCRPKIMLAMWWIIQIFMKDVFISFVWQPTNNIYFMEIILLV